MLLYFYLRTTLKTRLLLVSILCCSIDTFTRTGRIYQNTWEVTLHTVICFRLACNEIVCTQPSYMYFLTLALVHYSGIIFNQSDLIKVEKMWIDLYLLRIMLQYFRIERKQKLTDIKEDKYACICNVNKTIYQRNERSERSVPLKQVRKV